MGGRVVKEERYFNGRADTRRLAEEQEWLCWWCGMPMLNTNGPHELMASVEHIVPRRHGGTSWFGNLVAAHRACNTARGSSTDWHPCKTMWKTERMRRLFEANGMELPE